MPRFRVANEIFESETPLDPDEYQPDEILERESEMDEIANGLTPLVSGGKPRNILVYGKPGVGKTVIINSLIDELLSDTAEMDHVDITPLRLSCNALKTSYRCAVEICRQAQSHLGVEQIQKSGHSRAHVIDTMFEVLDELGGSTIIIFDDIDKIDDINDLLYELSRPAENGRLTDGSITVIGISNDFNFRDSLESDTKTSLAEKEVRLPTYTAGELQTILSHRAEMAFRDGVLEQATVPKCAAIAANDTGNARQGLELLRNAGQIARREEADSVTADHIETGKQKWVYNRLVDDIHNLTGQGQQVLGALCRLVQAGHSPAKTAEIYTEYTQVAQNNGNDPLVERRMRDRLNDLEMTGLVTVHERNRGPNAGRYYEYDLAVDADVVVDELISVLGMADYFTAER